MVVKFPTHIDALSGIHPRVEDGDLGHVPTVSVD